jgi:hypothetical protein
MRKLSMSATIAAGVIALVFATAGTAWASDPFGIEKFENTITENVGGTPATQAGSHPYAMTTTITFSSHPPNALEEEEGLKPAPNGNVKEAEVNLPVGVIVNPKATETKCTEAELDTTFECPNAAAVGVAAVKLGLLGAEGNVAVFNMVTPPGIPAEFGFDIAGIVVHIVGNVQTGSNYELSAKVSNILQKGAFYSAALTLWGDPTAESHDGERGYCAKNGGTCPVVRLNRAQLTMPSSCTGGPLRATMRANSWGEPENFVAAVAESSAVTGCEALGFAPGLSVQPVDPATPATESPTGLAVDLTVPQEENLTGLARSDLKEAVVELPLGVTVSPSAANGLGVCTDRPEPGRPGGEIALTSNEPVECPGSSKIGSVEVLTPLLEQPLEGSVYLAEQGNLAGRGSNPFGSLFALYLVAEGSGALVKLPGKIELNGATGQLTARFGEDPSTSLSTGTRQFLPQLPFSELKMDFFGGQRAPLATPPSCGTFTTTSQLTPWDGNPAAEPASSFAVSRGCSPRGFAPTVAAGTTNNQAGGFSPLNVTIARNDGEQNLGGITVTTPPGLLGMLSKVSLCQEPQASQGTCGEESRIGETTVATGPGEDPYWVKGGRVYLTGPYKGAPFGLSIVVPTVAGPFTLAGNGGPGREIVRAAIAVNPKTSALTVTGEPLPSILQGVPLDIRTVNVDINREGFMFNPTNCEALAVSSTITSVQGAAASSTSHFQAANCAALPFKPSLTATTQGKASYHGNGASLNVKVTQKSGEAGIRSVRLELPKKLPARLSTLQKACTEATFDTNPALCPAASDVGTGIARTPVLPVPLQGPAYFVSHGGAQYPEIVFVLQGDGVTIDFAGETRINSKTKITSSAFEAVPDAPITSFEANLPERSNSALATLTAKGLCGSQSLSMPTTIVGQNGARVTQTTKVAITGCPKKRKVAKKPRGKKARG